MAFAQTAPFVACRAPRVAVPRRGAVVPKAAAREQSWAQRAASAAVAAVLLASPVSEAIAGEFDVRL